MLKRVKFLTSGANSAMGAFRAGDYGMVSADMAKHLVEETGAAEYDKAEKKDEKTEKVVKGK